MSDIEALEGQIENLSKQVAGLQSLIIQFFSETQDSKILPLKDAAIELGCGTGSPESAYRSALHLIRSGHYRVGIEALDRRTPGASQASWYLDLERCIERDRVSPARRK